MAWCATCPYVAGRVPVHQLRTRTVPQGISTTHVQQASPCTRPGSSGANRKLESPEASPCPENLPPSSHNTMPKDSPLLPIWHILALPRGAAYEQLHMPQGPANLVLTYGLIRPQYKTHASAPCAARCVRRRRATHAPAAAGRPRRGCCL